MSRFASMSKRYGSSTATHSTITMTTLNPDGRTFRDIYQVMRTLDSETSHGHLDDTHLPHLNISYKTLDFFQVRKIVVVEVDEKSATLHPSNRPSLPMTRLAY